MPTTADETERLRGFVIEVARFLLAGPENDAMLTQVVSSVRESNSLPGLREAARDMVEWAQDLRGERLAQLDALLSESSLPTLSSMRASR